MSSAGGLVEAGRPPLGRVPEGPLPEAAEVSDVPGPLAAGAGEGALGDLLAQIPLASHEGIHRTAQHAGSPAQTLLGTGETLHVTLPLGEHHLTLRVIDSAGESDTDEIVTRVVDTTPPQMSAELSPLKPWPPNHGMVEVTATASASDLCGPASLQLASVTCNEPDDAPGMGDGETAGDIHGAEPGAPDFAFELRAERGGSGAGRVYTALYRAVDGSGNAAERTSSVVVPLR